MLYSTYSGISLSSNSLNCVVIRCCTAGWKIDSHFTFVVENEHDWKNSWAKLKKRLPRWRNCVSVSLGFEEVLSKSSVINASLSEQETAIHVQEQLSRSIVHGELVYDYRKSDRVDDGQELELYICKKEALTRLLERCQLRVDVVGWTFTDLQALSKELDLPHREEVDGFIEITESRMAAASFKQQSLPIMFDIKGQSLSTCSERVLSTFHTLSTDSNTGSTTFLIYGCEERIAELNGLLTHSSGFNLIDVSHTHIGQYLTSFAAVYPALACALGAYYWSKACQ